MKMNDIIPEHEMRILESDDENCVCGVCETHDRAYKQIENGIKCPYCGEIHNIEDGDYAVVGESNVYNPEHNIGKFLTFRCYKCCEHFSLFPEKILYNGNHDIYYTGGRDYLIKDDATEAIFKLAEEKINKSLQQWITRYENGEKLKSNYPALWIKRDIEDAIANYLFNQGLKK